MMTAALFCSLYFGMIKETGWTSPLAKVLLAFVASWFAFPAIFVDMILMPLAAFGWLMEKLRRDV